MTKRIPGQYKRDRGYARPKGWNNLYSRFFPEKTCPASRHTYMICDYLRDPTSPIRRLLIDAGYEPDHWASSIEVTVVGLWEAREHLEWENLPPTRRYKYNGHWVPKAQADRNPKGQDGEARLGAKHESAVAKPCARKGS